MIHEHINEAMTPRPRAKRKAVHRRLIGMREIILVLVGRHRTEMLNVAK